MVGRGSVVPFWTCKVEIPIRCNSCCFKTNEWHVIESYGRPVRFLICSNYNEKLERGREWQMSQSQRGHGELSLSQSSKKAESESKKEASCRKESILSKELNTSWGVIRVPHPRGRCELSCCSLGLPLSFWLSSSGHKFSSVQFSRSVLSDSLRLQGPQHARPLCTSPTPRVYSNSCPLSRWCHPAISSSVVPFSSCLQSFPASGSFQMSQSFTSGGQVLEFQLQRQSFQWIFRTDFL